MKNKKKGASAAQPEGLQKKNAARARPSQKAEENVIHKDSAMDSAVPYTASLTGLDIARIIPSDPLWPRIARVLILFRGRSIIYSNSVLNLPVSQQVCSY